LIGAGAERSITPSFETAPSRAGAPMRHERTFSPALLAQVFVIHTTATIARAFVVGGWSLSFDEAFSWRMSRFPAAELVKRTARDVHPPAYYLLLKGWTHWAGDSPESMRLMSVILAMLAGLALHGLLLEATASSEAGLARGTRPGGRAWTCLLSSVLVVSSPLINRHAVEARMYPLAAALAILAGWCLLAALRRGDRSTFWWVVYAGSSALGCYVHNYALFSLAGQTAFLAGWCLSRSGPSVVRLLAMPETRRGFVATAAVVVAYLPWLPIALAQSGAVGGDYATGRFDPGHLPAEIGYLFTGLDWLAEPPLPEAWCAGLVVLLVLLAVRPSGAGRLLALMIAGPLTLGVMASLVVGRDVLFARHVYPSVFAIAGGLAVLIARIPDLTTRSVASALAVTTTAGLTASLYDRVGADRHPGLLGATRELARRWQPGEEIFAFGPEIYLALQLESRRLGLASPRMIRATRRPLEHYRGGPVIDPAEITTPTEAAALAGTSAWVVEARSAWRYVTPLPPGWRRADESRFPEVRIVGRDIVFLDRIVCGTAPARDAEGGLRP